MDPVARGDRPYVDPVGRVGGVVPLARRLAEQTAPGPVSDEAPIPLPGPIDCTGLSPAQCRIQKEQRECEAAGRTPIECGIREVVKTMFFEKLFYGEEEENGIPSLSVEI